MTDSALGLASVFCGCQANIFFLELIITGSPHTYYALTCAQYVCVVVFTLPFLLRFRKHQSEQGVASSCWPFQWRRSRILFRHKLILAVAGWAMSLGSNLSFGFNISIPLHATFRSSSLMLNMVVGYMFGRRFTPSQVACALLICVGLIALTAEKVRRSSGAGAEAAYGTGDDVSTPTWHWMCGVAILVATTICTTALGIFQDHMYSYARALEAARTGPIKNDDAPLMWLEALCCSHLFAIPLFLLKPARLYTEAAHLREGSQLHVALNCLTQVVCIAGVYVLNDTTSSFTLTLVLTLRKLASFVLSVVYFGHYRHFSNVEWVAMFGALMAGTAYPFLKGKKTHPHKPGVGGVVIPSKVGKRH